jgi:hypothetical protein
VSVEDAARTLAAARRARVFHPAGRTFRATVHAAGGGTYGVPLLDRAGEYAALVRLSRGAGLPAGWPDVLGFALRVAGGAGPDVDLDVLASTVAGLGPVGRRVPFPRRDPVAPYTTVSGYATRHGRRWIAVAPRPDGSYALGLAGRAGRWRTFARVTLAEPLPADDDERLWFDPSIRAAGGLRPGGPLWRLRAVAYRGSRAGRASTTRPDDHVG